MSSRSSFMPNHRIQMFRNIPQSPRYTYEVCFSFSFLWYSYSFCCCCLLTETEMFLSWRKKSKGIRFLCRIVLHHGKGNTMIACNHRFERLYWNSLIQSALKKIHNCHHSELIVSFKIVYNFFQYIVRFNKECTTSRIFIDKFLKDFISVKFN